MCLLLSIYLEVMSCLLDYPMYYGHLSLLMLPLFATRWQELEVKMKSDIIKDHKNPKNVYTKMNMSSRHHCWFRVDQELWHGSMLSFGEAKVVADAPSIKIYAKKIWTTPRPTCVWNLGDDTNTIKLVINRAHFATKWIPKVNWK
jgi:hypothetical protein